MDGKVSIMLYACYGSLCICNDISSFAMESPRTLPNDCRQQFLPKKAAVYSLFYPLYFFDSESTGFFQEEESCFTEGCHASLCEMNQVGPDPPGGRDRHTIVDPVRDSKCFRPTQIDKCPCAKVAVKLTSFGMGEKYPTSRLSFNCLPHDASHICTFTRRGTMGFQFRKLICMLACTVHFILLLETASRK